MAIDAIETSTPGSTTPPAPSGSITFNRVPQKAGTFLSMHGRDANMVIADYAFDGQKLMYSTSELFTKMPVTTGTLLVLSGAKNDAGESVLQYASEPVVTTLGGAPVESVWDAATKTMRLNYVHGNGTSVKITGGGAPELRIVTTDRTATGQQWTLDGIVKGGTTNKTVMVAGVDLLRSAEFDGDTVKLVGDTKAVRTMSIYVPAGITKATWNGQALTTTAGTNGQLVANLAGPAPAVLPALTNWKVSGENPESAVAFDDAAWLEATATTAANTRQGPGPNQGRSWTPPSMASTRAIPGTAHTSRLPPMPPASSCAARVAPPQICWSGSTAPLSAQRQQTATWPQFRFLPVSSRTAKPRWFRQWSATTARTLTGLTTACPARTADSSTRCCPAAVP
ncbi:beta-galactosidase domain 3-containing protein [Arthrobacter alpinus]|nr:beta-galactosidase domain 3-containing protein [Arthrobacter alpinus]